MIKRNPTKPVRVVPPMMEEQEVSTITLQELSLIHISEPTRP